LSELLCDAPCTIIAHNDMHIYTLASNCQARYTLATKLNSTRSTLLKVDCCRNWQQFGTKSVVVIYVQLCCRYVQLCCRFWQQIGNNMNSTACRGRLCCRYGRLCCQCVRLSTKSTVLNSTLSLVCTGLYR